MPGPGRKIKKAQVLNPTGRNGDDTGNRPEAYKQADRVISSVIASLTNDELQKIGENAILKRKDGDIVSLRLITETLQRTGCKVTYPAGTQTADNSTITLEQARENLARSLKESNGSD